ncbi:DnaJ-domain-containing protein [Durotheca rogersii]|uniref:DnaJ-domain-containing protein n=1 Tax=Durotheca rogersii TaxID=419775 RepID=UPI002220E5DB|nr:DnaJ-domain-containing protein [Durotheca rogersii]KAI5857277.1 DnaJ-domain-containing protein [Durotheca rogersii]
MGAQQSAPRGTTTNNQSPKRTDYYQLLGVDQQVADDEIKKAYKRKALELHPDRNFGDAENATRRFAEVQVAYEVLSDPQERAWYDSHRDAILHGDDPTGHEIPPEYNNVRLATADEIFDLIGGFNKAIPFDDSPNGFFTILRETFERLAEGEKVAAEWDGQNHPQYPAFGSSTDDDRVTKAFYSQWANFSTRLNFSWKDKWRLSDAQDRRTRRVMEKENRKLREDAVRQFNDAVRSLVTLARKRDPRYLPNKQSKAERQRVLRESAAAQAARSRAANQRKMNDISAIPDWVLPQGDGLYQGEFSETDEELEIEHSECVVCSKMFKSEKQYEAHEKSKKHIKAVQQLQRQMRKENETFVLGEPISLAVADNCVDVDAADAVGRSTLDIAREDGIDQAGAFTNSDSEPTLLRVTTNASVLDDGREEGESDDHTSRDALEGLPRLQGDEESQIDNLVKSVEDISPTLNEPSKKVGKAKVKREKRAARQAALGLEAGVRCAACNDTFDSRTKLFKHLNETGHATTRSNISRPNKK